MIILKIFIMFFVLLIIPEFIGMLITRFLRDRNIIINFVVGFLANLALFQLIAIPLILCSCSFNLLYYTYLFVILCITIISIIVNIKEFKAIITNTINEIKSNSKLLMLCVIALIGLQIFISIYYTHIDDDDTIYVGTSTTTLGTNSMYIADARTGKNYNTFPKKYALAPFSIYVSVISKCSLIHPAIIAHTVLPSVLIFLSYMVYLLIGNELFDGNKKSAILFLIILSIVNLWGNYSPKTNYSFLLFRIWQGKAILANIVIPAIWLFFLKAEKNEFKLIDCIILTIVNFAGTLTTTLGIGFPSIVLLILAIIFSIINKRKDYIAKTMLCCVPSFIIGIIYFLYNMIVY